MIAKVDKDVCIGCGLCTSICPNVFHMEDDGLAVGLTTTVPKPGSQEACDNCPVSAISIDTEEPARTTTIRMS